MLEPRRGYDWVSVSKVGGIFVHKTRRTHLGEKFTFAIRESTMPYTSVLAGLHHVRNIFEKKSIHVFGVGGTATLHLAALRRERRRKQSLIFTRGDHAPHHM